jgi:protocatechuate 3,4-dioxygenase beta subunit
MNRRAFLVALPAAAAALTLRPDLAHGQDPDFVRAWERAQTRRPRMVTRSARIAAAGEPGTPLVVHGRLFQRDGRTPAANVVVFAYHTDSRGHYDEASQGAHSWRLQGWARTDAAGAFEFETIRPAPYPGRTIPAHIHLSLEGPGVPRRWTPEVWFEDDDILTTAQRAASRREGEFGQVRPVTRRGETIHVDVNLRIDDHGRF